MQRGAPLAVVVIAFRAPPELAEAVQSVLGQDTPVELLVVNSGGGDAGGLLRAKGIDVPVHETAERLFVGAARNIGIRETNARWVAFLASDCLAGPKWVSERLRLHQAGAGAVASAVMPDQPESLVAWAHHLLLFPRRLPGLGAEDALRYGVSFDRRIFDEIGLFDGSLASGEDTDLLARLPEPQKPVWAPTVITLHRNARDLGSLLRDQVVRGYRYSAAMRRLRGSSPFVLIKQSLREPKRARRLARAGLTGRDLAFAMSSRWLVRLGSIARVFGILAQAWGMRIGDPQITSANGDRRTSPTAARGRSP